jgi:hypothetical protein
MYETFRLMQIQILKTLSGETERNLLNLLTCGLKLGRYHIYIFGCAFYRNFKEIYREESGITEIKEGTYMEMKIQN